MVDYNTLLLEDLNLLGYIRSPRVQNVSETLNFGSLLSKEISKVLPQSLQIIDLISKFLHKELTIYLKLVDLVRFPWLPFHLYESIGLDDIVNKTPRKALAEGIGLVIFINFQVKLQLLEILSLTFSILKGLIPRIHKIIRLRRRVS